MAEFQVQAMADSGGSSEDLPRRGRVTEVCREWLMHEDLALAHRLQNEEYQSHLVSNRERNQRLREDTPRARQEQTREDHEAAVAQTALEMYLAQQEARDAEMAAVLARRLEMEEDQHRQDQEHQDLMYARAIMDREKEVVRQVRELRQVEREAAYLGINSGNDNVALLARKEPRSHESNVSAGSDRSARGDLDLSDLSDFCLQPTDDMDEDQVRVLQEDQDASEDGQRRGDRLRQDQLMAIEAQDRELAKVLQEQERAKAKKAREKARQKALQKKQARAGQTHEGHTSDAYPGPSQPGPSQPGPSQPGPSQPGPSQPGPSQPGPSYASPPDSGEGGDQPSPRPSTGSRDSPEPALPPRRPVLQRPTSLDLPGASRAPLTPVEKPPIKYAVGKTNKPRAPDPHPPEQLNGTLSSTGSSSSSSSSTGPDTSLGSRGFTNIACAIDPTYQRRVRQGELPVSPQPAYPRDASPQATLQSSSSSSSSSSYQGITSPVSPLPPPVLEEDEDYPAPPYMPIQGQRRTASLEKTPRRHKPPKEKTKDGCKQQ